MKIHAETERLLLRNMHPDDAPDFFEMNSDLEVQKYTGDHIPKSVEEVRTFITNYPDYTNPGYGRWAIQLKETGEVIGFTGLKYLPEFEEVDIGYRLKKQHWGKGYATESCWPALVFAFENLKLSSLVLYAMPDNAGSVNIANKLGFTYEETIDYDGDDAMRFRLTRAEYMKR